MKLRTLGNGGPRVSAIGLGCMSIGIADTYTSSVRDDGAAVALIHRALDLGITLLDTADIYGDSEQYRSARRSGRRDDVVLATKFGFVRATGPGHRGIDGSPRVRRARRATRRCGASASITSISTTCIGWIPHVPIEETVGAMADLVQRGQGALPRPVGGARQRRFAGAHKVHPIAAVQTEYSLCSRDPEDELLPTLRELGIALVAYSPLGRGFLGGALPQARRPRARRLAS